MVTKGRKKGTVRFSIKPQQPARKAFVAGSFNNWTPARMRKQKDGTFVLIAPLGRGTQEYKFLLDDQWVVDPDNGAWAMNPYGTLNSVVTVD
ncbi:MAG: isoamylase early set domain-containing protein [Planctomycetes bacterium]|nr:isoamylase early set domain-containing protein [Planctomycetota bacterium]